MASSRRTGTNENISTYDSAGGKDYSALSTWEADTDNNLVSLTQSEVLECYNGPHSDGNVRFTGATTNVFYFRIIRPASGHGHNGTPNSGVKVVNTVDGYCFYADEDYFSFQDLIIEMDLDSATSRPTVSILGGGFASCIGLIVFGDNAGAGSINGIQWGQTASDQYIVNCIVFGVDGDGFKGSGASNTPRVYNCTSINNTGYGFVTDSTNNSYYKNCTSSGNGTNTITALTYGTAHQTTCYVSATLPSFRDSSSDDYHISDLDTVRPPGKLLYGKGTDLSADGVFAFDDDIDGETRYGSWDIGHDQYSAVYGTEGIGSAQLADVLVGDFYIKGLFSLIASNVDTQGCNLDWPEYTG